MRQLVTGRLHARLRGENVGHERHDYVKCPGKSREAGRDADDAAPPQIPAIKQFEAE